MTLSWKRDGDQHVATGGMGEYRVTEWVLRDGSDFVIYVKRKSDGASKSIGGFSSLKNAQAAAQNYDGYRAVDTRTPKQRKQVRDVCKALNIRL